MKKAFRELNDTSYLQQIESNPQPSSKQQESERLPELSSDSAAHLQSCEMPNSSQDQLPHSNFEECSLD